MNVAFSAWLRHLVNSDEPIPEAAVSVAVQVLTAATADSQVLSALLSRPEVPAAAVARLRAAHPRGECPSFVAACLVRPEHDLAGAVARIQDSLSVADEIVLIRSAHEPHLAAALAAASDARDDLRKAEICSRVAAHPNAGPGLRTRALLALDAVAARCGRECRDASMIWHAYRRAVHAAGVEEASALATAVTAKDILTTLARRPLTAAAAQAMTERWLLPELTACLEGEHQLGVDDLFELIVQLTPQLPQTWVLRVRDAATDERLPLAVARTFVGALGTGCDVQWGRWSAHWVLAAAGDELIGGWLTTALAEAADRVDLELLVRLADDFTGTFDQLLAVAEGVGELRERRAA